MGAVAGGPSTSWPLGGQSWENSGPEWERPIEEVVGLWALDGSVCISKMLSLGEWFTVSRMLLNPESAGPQILTHQNAENTRHG